MVLLKRLTAGVFLGLAASLTLPAATPGNTNLLTSYQLIIDRNPFDLKPIPEPAPVTNAAPPAPQADVFLTGITTLVHPKRAYIMTKTAKGDPQYYSLAEQEAKDGLEVLQIDEDTKTVRVRNSGTETILSFATHGIKSPDTVPNSTTGTLPGKMPNTLPVAMPFPATIPPPGMGLPGGSANPYTSYTAPNAATYGGTTPALPGAYSIPTRTVRTTADAAGSAAYNTGLVPSRTAASPIDTTPTPSAEEQVIMMELQRKTHPNIPFPPTPGLPGGPLVPAPPRVPR